MVKLNKKIYSKLDWLTYVMVFSFFLSISLTLTFGDVSKIWWVYLIFAVILFFIFYSWFKTYYILSNKKLDIIDGSKNIEVFYREVVSVEKTKCKIKEVAGFSGTCIRIKYGKNGRNAINISPIKQEQFYQFLKEKCRNIEEEK